MSDPHHPYTGMIALYRKSSQKLSYMNISRSFSIIYVIELGSACFASITDSEIYFCFYTFQDVAVRYTINCV